MRRSYLTNSRHNEILNCPVNLPQTELFPGDSILVGSVPLSLGQEMTIDWLSMFVVKTTSGVPVKLISQLGICYVGCYCGGFTTNRPSGIPPLVLHADTIGYKTVNTALSWKFNTPDNYVFLVCNNTSNITISVTVIGISRVFLRG